MVWYSCEEISIEEQTAIVQSVAQAGCSTAPMERSSSGSGIVIISNVTDHSLDRIRHLSENGDRRILVVLSRTTRPTSPGGSSRRARPTS